MFKSLHVVDIGNGNLNLRAVSRQRVDQLAAWIKESGTLINPILVRPAQIRDWNTGNKFDGYEVVAGFHRFAAIKKLKWDMVDCHVVEVEELEATLLTCDENLARFDLSKAERAVITQRRKEAYEGIHPTAKHGAAGGHGKAAVAKFATVDHGFVADTVEKTGKSERIIQLDAERGTKIDPTVLREISGTELGRVLN